MQQAEALAASAFSGLFSLILYLGFRALFETPQSSKWALFLCDNKTEAILNHHVARHYEEIE